MEDLVNSQRQNVDWSWRGARRLAEAKALVAASNRPRALPYNRDCAGRIVPFRVEVAPPAPPPPFPPKLTGEPGK
jgi:hypothetical protein